MKLRAVLPATAIALLSAAASAPLRRW